MAIVLARVLAFLVGATVVMSTLASAIKTVVMPRAEPSILARWVFVTLRKPFDLRIRRAKTWPDADRTMARFAPFALLLLPGVWVAVVIVGFVPIYWALGMDVPRDAFVQSGSSLLTLGFSFDSHGPVVAATFVETTLGLGLVALLISFLPTMYQQFSHREVLVSQLDTRAGTPPTPVALFRRAKLIGWVGQLDAAYDIRFDPNPAPDDPISITRAEFDDVLDQLQVIGVPIKADRDQAWRDFAGWRVNYDTPLLALALCGLLMAPFAPWSSDRSVNYRIRQMNGPRRRARGWPARCRTPEAVDLGPPKVSQGVSTTGP
jgi:hypothetical protein